MSGLKNELLTQGSPLSNLNGGPTPNNLPTLQGSLVHDEYSINNQPPIPSLPVPSQLDLEGAIPPYNYVDNAPENASW